MPTPAQKIAAAMRHAAERSHERRGRGRYAGTVVGVDPLRVDVHGIDLDLGAGDVTLGRSVTAGPDLEVGDVLVLVELDDGEFVAVDVREAG